MRKNWYRKQRIQKDYTSVPASLKDVESKQQNNTGVKEKKEKKHILKIEEEAISLGTAVSIIQNQPERKYTMSLRKHEDAK